MKKHLLLYAAFGLAVHSAWSQGSADYGSGIKLSLNEDGSKYIRFITWNQIWARSIEHNPGTQINGLDASRSWDVSGRRLRMLAFTQVNKRYLILTHFGINNQTFTNGGAAGTAGTGGYGAGKKPGLFFHDAWNEYAVVLPKKDKPFSLSVGAGLHYYMGVSRMTMASTLNFLAVDAPIHNWNQIELSDQFARQYGIFAKGRYGKFNYSFAANKPFATNGTPDLDKAVNSAPNPKAAFTGYVDLQLLDQESNLLPYRVGTYIGTKKVFNLGLGFYQNSDATASLNDAGEVVTHDNLVAAADLFLDYPLGARNDAVTVYASATSYQFGPNYLRTVGIMNPASGLNPNITPSINGSGNNRILLGTGTQLYVQAGYLLPKSEKQGTRVQAFAAYTGQSLEALDELGHSFDLGFNVFLDGHHAKITPQYSLRPQFFNTNGLKTVGGYGSELIIQAQIYL